MIRTLLIVTAVHALFLAALSVGHAPPTPPPSRPHIVVSTVKLQPKPRPAPPKAQPKPQPKAPAQPKPKPKPIAKPQPKPKPKPAAKPKPKPTTKPVAKPQVDKKQQELLAKAQQSVAKIGASGNKRSAPDPYAQELATRLKLLLRLPGYGAVRIGLTLGRDGSVVSAKVLEAHSDENRNYVVEALNGAQFAPFERSYPGEQTHTFTLTFANE